MQMKNVVTAAALTLFVATVPAMAKSHGKSKGWSKHERAELSEQFARLDRNGDGFLTRAEFPADSLLFDRLDLNRDGLLTRTEIRQAVPNREGAERQLRGFDRNRDGIITRDEFPGNDNAFNRLDRNGDGVISQADHGRRGRGKNRD